MIAAAQCPSQPGVDGIVEIVHDYAWRLLKAGKLHVPLVRRRRLLECIAAQSGGQPFLASAASWDQTRQRLLNSATACA